MVLGKSLLATLAFTCVSAVASSTWASSVTLTLFPSQASPEVGAFTNIVGNQATSAPGFGSGSWQAADTTAGSKSELYIPVGLLFSGTVTVNDIASIGYWTNKSSGAGAPDWVFLIYTAPQSSGNEASWYHTRLNSEPYLTGTSSVAPGTWHQWSTNDPNNPMRFYDAGRDGNILGTYTDPTLASLQAGNVSWPHGSSVNYGSESIEYFSLQTGSGWADGFTGLVDGMQITLKNGDTANVNLEAVPLPTAAWSAAPLLVGLAGLGVFRKFRRIAAVVV